MHTTLTIRIARACIIAALGAAGTTPAAGQEAINFDSAFQPGAGETIMRLRTLYVDAGGPMAGREVQMWQSSATVVHGLQADLTLIGNLPALSRRVRDAPGGPVHRDEGFGEPRLLLKQLIHRNDSGPTDTVRVGLLGGLIFPSIDDEFPTDSFDPLVGLVYTQSIDRHGLNAQAQWRFNTDGGSPDLLRYDAAYVYRLAPESFSFERQTAWYGVVELNGFSETNGDHELFASVGAQYVTRQWAVEGSVQLPVWQEVDRRAERDLIVGVSLRFHF